MAGVVNTLRKRRSYTAVLICLVLVVMQMYDIGVWQESGSEKVQPSTPTEVLSDTTDSRDVLAVAMLDQLEVKGRAAKTGYSRAQFSDGWASVENCDLRNIILARDLRDIVREGGGCIVMSGTLDDPYTGTSIVFSRGDETSDKVQIDHVVALSDAWQKGAQNLDADQRFQFANDPLNLLAVDGNANQQKSNSDAASWLPANKSYRCRYVARQIAVKRAYNLWVTDAEKSAMKRVLSGCEGQPVPRVE